MTWVLIGINVLIFYFELHMPKQLREYLTCLFGIVPARFTHPAWAAEVGFPADEYWPCLTSAFLHGSWAHIIGNMWTLWIFGQHVEDRMGSFRYPAFYLICADDSGVVHTFVNAHSAVPAIGASGAIAGVMGAYAATQTARAIHGLPGKATVPGPHDAMSAGTLIALAADENILSKHAVPGPVDPQTGQFPAASILKVVAQKSIDEIDDSTLIMADQAGKAIAQVRATAAELLKDKCNPDKADELATMLSEGRWTHDHAITFEHAKEFGLRVSDETPEEFMKLMTLYPQPVRRQPTVEYLPIPRHGGEPAAGH